MSSFPLVCVFSPIRILVGMLVVSAVFTRTGTCANAEINARLSVFAPYPGKAENFTATSSGSDARIVSAAPMSKARPLVLVVDPNSYGRSEVRRQIGSFAKALVARARSSAEPWNIRVGLPILDGILSPPVADSNSLAAALDKAVANFIPEDLEGRRATFGRTVDLIGTLIERAEKEGGAVDCLLLFRDRGLEGEDSAYLNSGLQRYLASLALREGSVVHGYLEGSGILRDACMATGGLVWNSSTAPGQVIQQLGELRSRGYLLEAYVPVPSRAECLRIEVRANLEGGKPVILREPSLLCWHPDGTSPPNHYRMRQGLDWVRRAREAHSEGNLTLAVRYAGSALSEDSWNPESHYLAGKAAADSGDLAAARSMVDRALRSPGPDERSVLLYGEVYRRLGKASEALSGLQSLIVRGPAPTARLKVEIARLNAAAGNDGSARDLFHEALTAGLDDDVVRADYGEILERLGSREASREQFELSLARNPHNVKALLHLARSAADAGRMEEALMLAQKAVTGNPKNPDAQAGLGTLLGKRREWDRAIENLRIAIVLAPDRRDIKDLYVDALLSAEREEDAIDFLREALVSDATDARTIRKLAEVQLRIGEFGDAIQTLEIGAARESPESYLLYQQAAELHERRGQYGQALLNYRAMLRAAPAGQAADLKAALSPHLVSLALLVGSGGKLAELPLAKEFELEKPISGLAEKERANQKSVGVTGAGSGIVVPGGLALLARSVGVDLSDLREPDALERVFSFILESSSPKSGRLENNQVWKDAVQYLRSHEDLIRHLQKQRLLPKDFDPKRPQELAFSLGSGAGAPQDTKRFLSFFGMSLQTKRGADGQPSITLTLKQSRSSAQRQQLLRNMGVNLLNYSLREIRVTVGDAELPILLGPETWATQILPRDKAKSRGLLDRMLRDDRVMRLYSALAGCSEATRTALVKVLSPGELLSSAVLLQSYGRYLDFKGGELTFPGSRESWEALLGVPDGNSGSVVVSLLRRDNGQALLSYASLSSAPKSVQSYLTASPDRLRSVHQILGLSPTSSGFGEPGRILERMTADERSLFLPIDRRFSSAILGGVAASEKGPAASGFQLLRVDDKHLCKLFDAGSAKGVAESPTPVEMIELLSYLQSAHPEMLDEETARAILRDPAAAPAMLDLIMDLSPPASLLARYLAFAKALASSGARGWNANRTRTCQSLLHLLSLLARQGALGKEEGISLFRSALERLNAPDEAVFAEQVVQFLSEQLLPALERHHSYSSSDDFFLQALAGPSQVREFTFEGKRLQLDSAAFKLQQIKGAIQHQRYTPLAQLLEAFRALSELRRGGEATEALKALKKAVEAIQTPDLGQDAPRAGRQAIPFADRDSLVAKLDGHIRGKRRTASSPNQLVSEMAAALHTELGVTLLTYCYAFHGVPEADVLAFDPNFVRKHDFHGAMGTSAGCWASARMQQEFGTMRSHCAGSLSGLGFELNRIETAQAAQSFGRREELGLVPTILAGMRAVPRQLRSDRAQEYVALSARLGQEILALASLDSDLKTWCEAFCDARIPPRRRELIRRSIEEGNPQMAAAALSPSELFMIGHEYVARADIEGINSRPGASDEPSWASDSLLAGSSPPEMKGRSGLYSPILARLLELVREAESEGRSDFRRALEQYGVFLRWRLGVSRSSLAFSDSYERLELSTRREMLYDRICDLKVRMAELNYALGIPAYVSEVEGDLAIRDILPHKTSVHTNSWKLALDQISRLEPEHARNWIDELLNRGILVAASKSPGANHRRGS